MRIADFGFAPAINNPSSNSLMRIVDCGCRIQWQIRNPQSNYWLNVKFTSMVVATSTGSLLRKVGW